MQPSNSMLLRMPEVQQDLGLSPEQKTRLEELLRSLEEQTQATFRNLDFQEMERLAPEEREKRFAELRKKVEDLNKQADDKVASTLKSEQRERLGQLQLQREGAGALNRPEIAKQLGLTDQQQAKINQERENPRADLLSVLTDAQKAKWAALKGKEFPFPQMRGPGPGGFGPGGPGGFPGGGEAMALESVKVQIKANDEEWKVIGPKLRAVVAARRAVLAGFNTGAVPNNAGPRGGMDGPRGRGPGGGPRGGGGPGFGGDSFSGPADAGPGGFGPGGFGPGGPGGGRRGGFGRGDFGPPDGVGPGDAGPRDNPRQGVADPSPRENSERPNTDRRADGTGQGGSSRDLSQTATNARPSAPAPVAGSADRSPGGSLPPGGGLPETLPPGGGAPSASPLSGGLPPGGGVPAGGLPPGAVSPGGLPPGGPGGPPGFGMRDGVVGAALAELQATLADQKSSPEQIREKVAAVRAARKKAMAKLEAAQKELLELLAPDQEAAMVGLGYLD
ncbi:MAG: hypothetical protein ACYC35_14215 [Pirellulales bacterium]